MKTLKRVIVGSFLSMALVVPTVAMALEPAASEPKVVAVYCLSCGTHHLIEIS